MSERHFDNLKPKEPREEDLTPEEAAEVAANAVLAREVTQLRQADLLAVYGKTEEELALDADALLKAAGFEDLIEQPKTQPKPKADGDNK